ncbi:Putative DNA-binding domain protein [uncultured archaeon]|nr:Putative DNA-binding domain protein [uncultured archaeon]
MREVVGGVVINEIEAEPLSEYVIDFLCDRKKECPYLDFKFTTHIERISDFPEVAKDIFAFSNYGGGWILIGWKEIKSSQYVPEGLPADYNVDQAKLQEKFNSYSNIPIELSYIEFTKYSKRLAAIYIPPAYDILKPIKEGIYKKGDKDRIVFKKGDIFYRRGTQSIPPSDREVEIITKRLKKENYRLSVLSGEPDEIVETIYSNLFPVIELPEFIYSGLKKDYDNKSIQVLLKQEGVNPSYMFKFIENEGRIYTFDNLYEEMNPYRKLVHVKSLSREPVNSWIDNLSKNKLLVQLLNLEFRHYAVSLGLSYFPLSDELYYSTEGETRRITWRGRYGKSTRTVATMMFADQLNRYIFRHAAISSNFVQLGKGKFFLKILPTFIITEDGYHVIKGLKEGTIITRLSYNKYNNDFLNTIFFWIYQLGGGKDIIINDYLSISSEPLKFDSEIGILFDIPSSEFKLDIGGEELLDGSDEFE